MVIASSNLATEFTTCRGRASLQTLAIVEICSLLEVAMVLSAASMSPKNAEITTYTKEDSYANLYEIKT